MPKARRMAADGKDERRAVPDASNTLTGSAKRKWKPEFMSMLAWAKLKERKESVVNRWGKRLSIADRGCTSFGRSKWCAEEVLSTRAKA